MSYLGQAALKNSEIKRFDVSSSTSATHTLGWSPVNEQSIFVTINGVKQQDDAYSIAGAVLTLTDALIATDKMEVIGILDIGVITTVGDNSISSSKLGTNAITAAKIQADAVITAKILDNNVTLAKQADGTQGGTIYYGAAGAPTELAAGTSGQFLKTQGAAANPVWSAVPAGSPTGGGSDLVFYQNGQTVTTDYTVTASNNAMSAGPVTVASGIDVTLTGTSEWVIV